MSGVDSAAELRAGEGKTPSLILLGAPRCGTTALSGWMREAGLGVGTKDSFYLMDDDAGLRGPTHLTSHGVRGYLELFPNTPAPTVECAAGYLYQRLARDFIASWSSPPELCLVVRDPVARLRSVHRYFAGNLGLLHHTMDFDAYVDALFTASVPLPDKTVSDALRQGCYAAELEPWIDAFGIERVHVIAFEDLTQSPAAVVTRLVELAGSTPPGDLAKRDFEKHNSSYVPRSVHVARATAWARARMPSGKLRSWGGEKLRRIQSQGRDRETDPLDGQNETTKRLRDFYSGPNAVLSRDYGIDIRHWT